MKQKYGYPNSNHKREYCICFWFVYDFAYHLCNADIRFNESTSDVQGISIDRTWKKPFSTAGFLNMR